MNEIKEDNIEYIDYIDESNLYDIQLLVSKDLSEPYSIFTYRYFLQNWPNLCVCAYINTYDQGNSPLFSSSSPLFFFPSLSLSLLLFVLF